MKNHQLDDQQHATIIAALRYFQKANSDGLLDSWMEDLATNGGTVEALDAAGIDALIAHLQFEGDELAELKSDLDAKLAAMTAAEIAASFAAIGASVALRRPGMTAEHPGIEAVDEAFFKVAAALCKEYGPAGACILTGAPVRMPRTAPPTGTRRTTTSARTAATPPTTARATMAWADPVPTGHGRQPQTNQPTPMLRTNLPESIKLPCGTVLSHKISYTAGIGLSKSALIAKIKSRGGNYRLVEVLGRRLRGKEDLHHRPYRPTTWILTNLSGVDFADSSALPSASDGVSIPSRGGPDGTPG